MLLGRWMRTCEASVWEVSVPDGGQCRLCDLLVGWCRYSLNVGQCKSKRSGPLPGQVIVLVCLGRLDCGVRNVPANELEGTRFLLYIRPSADVISSILLRTLLPLEASSCELLQPQLRLRSQTHIQAPRNTTLNKSSPRQALRSTKLPSHLHWSRHSHLPT